jgi:hypothetical protein
VELPRSEHATHCMLSQNKPTRSEYSITKCYVDIIMVFLKLFIGTKCWYLILISELQLMKRNYWWTSRCRPPIDWHHESLLKSCDCPDKSPCMVQKALWYKSLGTRAPKIHKKIFCTKFRRKKSSEKHFVKVIT